MKAETEEDLALYMAMVSNPIRKRILEALGNFPSLPFIKLMYECSLSHPSHCGVFTYHLKKLIENGAILKKRDEYSLSSLGREWLKLTHKMEGEYMEKEVPSAEEKEIVMDKYCPLCLEAQLIAKVTPQIIRIKCKNPKCIIGGPIDKPPFYIAMNNKIPDWQERGLDIYDLIQKNKVKVTPEEKVKLYKMNNCPKCGSKNLIAEEFGPWYNKHCKDCNCCWGGVPLTAWDLPETVAFVRTHHKVAESFLGERVTIDGKTCWGIVDTDLNTNEKLVIYMDAETFRPVKIIMDFEGKPVKGEITQEELLEKFLAFKKQENEGQSP